MVAMGGMAVTNTTARPVSRSRSVISGNPRAGFFQRPWVHGACRTRSMSRPKLAWACIFRGQFEKCGSCSMLLCTSAMYPSTAGGGYEVQYQALPGHPPKRDMAKWQRGCSSC